MSGVKVHQPITTRLNPHQLQKREDRMQYRSKTWQEMAKNRGGLNTLMLVAQQQRRQITRLWWTIISEGLVLLFCVYTAGRVFGWW